MAEGVESGDALSSPYFGRSDRNPSTSETSSSDSMARDLQLGFNAEATGINPTEGFSPGGEERVQVPTQNQLNPAPVAQSPSVGFAQLTPTPVRLARGRNPPNPGEVRRSPPNLGPMAQSPPVVAQVPSAPIGLAGGRNSPDPGGVIHSRPNLGDNSVPAQLFAHVAAVISSNREEDLRARSEERAQAMADAEAQAETHAAATKAQAEVNAQLVSQLLTLAGVISSNREEDLRARSEEQAQARADAKAQAETHAAATKAQAEVNAQLVSQLLTLSGSMELYMSIRVKDGRDAVANIVGAENSAKHRTVEREKSESGSEYDSESGYEDDSESGYEDEDTFNSRPNGTAAADVENRNVENRSKLPSGDLSAFTRHSGDLKNLTSLQKYVAGAPVFDRAEGISNLGRWLSALSSFVRQANANGVFLTPYDEISLIADNIAPTHAAGTSQAPPTFAMQQRGCDLRALVVGAQAEDLFDNARGVGRPAAMYDRFMNPGIVHAQMLKISADTGRSFGKFTIDDWAGILNGLRRGLIEKLMCQSQIENEVTKSELTDDDSTLEYAMRTESMYLTALQNSKAFDQSLGLREVTVVQQVFEQCMTRLRAICPGMVGGVQSHWDYKLSNERTWFEVKQVAQRVNQMVQDNDANLSALSQAMLHRDLAMGRRFDEDDPEDDQEDDSSGDDPPPAHVPAGGN
jgi:hypothetical protein